MFCLLLLKWKGDGGEGGLLYLCVYYFYCYGCDECGLFFGMFMVIFCVVYWCWFKIYCLGLCSGGIGD